MSHIRPIAALIRWCRSFRAATAIEYALIAGGVALVILAAVFLAGGSLGSLFNALSGAMSDGAGRVSSP